jgi:hypothetical protein
MSEDKTIAAPRAAPVFAWLGPLAGFAEFGTEGYPRAVRRRLTIVNAMAFLIAVFSCWRLPSACSCRRQREQAARLAQRSCALRRG